MSGNYLKNDIIVMKRLPAAKLQKKNHQEIYLFYCNKNFYQYHDKKD